MRTRVFALTAVTAVLAFTGCQSLANLRIENPSYSIREVRPRVSVALPLSASTIDFDFLVGVKNPNRVALLLDRMDFNLLVNDNPIFNGVSAERIRIPANGSGDVRLRARVGYDSIRSLFREVADIVQGDRARYEIRGTAFYDTPLGQQSFPVTVYRSGSR